MYVTSVDKVREYKVNMKGTRGVKVKYLLHKGVGPKNFIPSNEEHQFNNIGDEKLQFLCTRETVK